MSSLRPLALLTILLTALLAMKGLGLIDGISQVFGSSALAQDAGDTGQDSEDDGDFPSLAPEEEEAPETETVALSQPVTSLDQCDVDPSLAAINRDGQSRSELDLLAALGARREVLNQRESELETREQLLTVAETRVDERIQRMEALRADIQTLLGELDEQRQLEIDTMVATYNTMEPDAAAIVMLELDNVDSEALLLVSTQLQTNNTRRFAAIMGELAELNAPFAASLTSRIHARSEPPATLADLEDSLEPSRE